MDLSKFFDEEDQESVTGYMFFDMSQIALASAFQEFPNTKVDINLLRHIVLNSIKFNLNKFKNDYPNVVLCYDNANGGYWRRDYGYYYKKTRAAAREESSFDWEGYFDAINQIKNEIAENMPYYTMDIERIEADDIIGTLVPRLANNKILIISSDKDYVQLHIYKNVKQWAANSKKFVTSKISPEEFLMTKLLKGDRKDSVAGVKCRSDYWYTRIDGERAPGVSSSLIKKCLDSSPENHLTEAEFKRYKENQIMIDMKFIPDNIKQIINNKFDNFVVPGRNKIYQYFVSKQLTQLARTINNF